MVVAAGSAYQGQYLPAYPSMASRCSPGPSSAVVEPLQPRLLAGASGPALGTSSRCNGQAAGEARGISGRLDLSAAISEDDRLPGSMRDSDDRPTSNSALPDSHFLSRLSHSCPYRQSLIFQGHRASVERYDADFAPDCTADCPWSCQADLGLSRPILTKRRRPGLSISGQSFDTPLIDSATTSCLDPTRFRTSSSFVCSGSARAPLLWLVTDPIWHR